MTLYQKVIAVFGMLRNSIGLKAARTDLAPEFDASSSYAVDRLVIYNNRLYRCTVEHAGPWNADHFSPTTIDDVIATKGGGSPFADELYVKDEGTGKYHKVVVETVGGVATLAVDQTEVSA